MISNPQKLDALTRILEVETFDGMIIFVRTKQATEDLAERLRARGFAAAAINGDLVQAQRERTIAQLKAGTIDMLVATDVAARGLDVERISHVVNYDIPTDTESYVHRIGRTGRAGRTGEAMLFVTPRERYLLAAIEKATRQPLEPMALPRVDDVNAPRVAKFAARITEVLAGQDLTAYEALITDYQAEHDVPTGPDRGRAGPDGARRRAAAAGRGPGADRRAGPPRDVRRRHRDVPDRDRPHPPGEAGQHRRRDHR